jgi:trk system potassium uptake protein TrkA
MKGLDLPGETRVICLYRDGRLVLPRDDTQLRAEDEVVCIAHRDRLDELEQRFNRTSRNNHRK